MDSPCRQTTSFQRRIDFEATSCAYGDRRRPVARNVLAANNKYTLTNITLALLFMHTRVTCVMQIDMFIHHV